MKTTEEFASQGGIAEQTISEEEAVQREIAQKSKEFVLTGAEVYAKA